MFSQKIENENLWQVRSSSASVSQLSGSSGRQMRWFGPVGTGFPCENDKRDVFGLNRKIYRERRENLNLKYVWATNIKPSLSAADLIILHLKHLQSSDNTTNFLY